MLCNTSRVENGSPPASPELALPLTSEVPAVLAVLRVEGTADEKVMYFASFPSRPGT